MEHIVDYEIKDDLSGDVTDSYTRFGYFIMKAETREELISYVSEAISEQNG